MSNNPKTNNLPLNNEDNKTATQQLKILNEYINIEALTEFAIFQKMREDKNKRSTNNNSSSSSIVVESNHTSNYPLSVIGQNKKIKSINNSIVETNQNNSLFSSNIFDANIFSKEQNKLIEPNKKTISQNELVPNSKKMSFEQTSTKSEENNNDTWKRQDYKTYQLNESKSDHLCDCVDTRCNIKGCIEECKKIANEIITKQSYNQIGFKKFHPNDVNVLIHIHTNCISYPSTSCLTKNNCYCLHIAEAHNKYGCMLETSTNKCIFRCHLCGKLIRPNKAFMEHAKGHISGKHSSFCYQRFKELVNNDHQEDLVKLEKDLINKEHNSKIIKSSSSISKSQEIEKDIKLILDESESQLNKSGISENQTKQNQEQKNNLSIINKIDQQLKQITPDQLISNNTKQIEETKQLLLKINESLDEIKKKINGSSLSIDASPFDINKK